MNARRILSRLRRSWYGMSWLQWRVLSVLLVVALASSLTATLLGCQTWDALLLNFGTEMAGAVVTYVLLQMVIGTRTRKEDLIAQMGSDVRDVAVPAANELRRHGWLTDGSLRGTNLMRANLQEAVLWRANLQGAHLLQANLQGAHLMRANLQEATLYTANLQGAHLMRANLQGTLLGFADLQGANLWEADLQGADLVGANLQGAWLAGADLQGAALTGVDLQGANLTWTDLSTALNLETAKLDGAKANSKTKWPEGFQVPDTVVMVED